MKDHMTIKDVTPGVKSAVNAYLMARAYAETMRQAVDKVHRGILMESPVTNGLEVEHGEPARLIIDPKDTWLCTDDAMIQDYYAECDKQLREKGLKPDDMPVDHCPALVAEHIQTQTEWLILDCAAEMMEIGFDGKELNHRLLCKGLDTRREFIGLIVKLVVNLPDFKNPMKKAA